MTTEEKARAYDEALSKCKAYIDDTEKRWSEEFSRATEEVFKEIFPELRESEDERIRKELINALMCQRDSFSAKGPYNNNVILPGFTMKVGKILTYLEKQKEQKHPDGCFTCGEYKKGYEEGRRNGFTAGYNKAMKEVEQEEQKPAEWSEEDKVMLNNIIWSVHMKSIIKPLYEMDDRSRYKKYEDFLKALPERFNLQPRTEWSEEDEKMLYQVLHYLDPTLSGAKREEIELWLKSLSSQYHEDFFKEGIGHYFFDGEKTHFCGSPAMETNENCISKEFDKNI